ncbi:MAG: hypothetical protein LBI56_04395 [Puniceicoccales bacterium]|jgi:hypothetical protein|nr:hypothetical protein [Puniceicoccales bacterium]
MDNKFLARVSFAGVPHTLPHSSDTSQATLFPMGAEAVCQLYWLLSSLNLVYSYSVNGTQVSRNFSATSSIIPKNRLIAPATFYATAYDSSRQTSYAIDLQLGTVYFDANNKSKVGLKLVIEEADSFGLIKLCLQPISGMSRVFRAFTFLGKELTIYLNYSSAQVTSASLINFSLTPNFFSI